MPEDMNALASGSLGHTRKLAFSNHAADLVRFIWQTGLSLFLPALHFSASSARVVPVGNTSHTSPTDQHLRVTRIGVHQSAAEVKRLRVLQCKDNNMGRLGSNMWKWGILMSSLDSMWGTFG
jgi:hypothetical protein